jgi:hypothetical protein
VNKVYPISQLICDLKEGYTLSSSEITDLRARVTVSIFSGQVSVYNCGGLIVDPQPTSITWDASGNPAYISSDEINKRLSYCLPTYFWHPQQQIRQRGAPKSEKSIKALLNSGELKVEAAKYAKTFKNNRRRIPTRVEVAKGLVRSVYKDNNFSPETLKHSLQKSWW